MLVRRADLNHCHVTGECTASVEPLGLAQEHGNVVGIPGLDAFPDIGPDEETLVEEDSVVLRIGVGCRTLSVKMVNVYVPDFASVSAAAQCFNQDSRSTGDAAEVYVVR